MPLAEKAFKSNERGMPVGSWGLLTKDSLYFAGFAGKVGQARPGPAALECADADARRSG